MENLLNCNGRRFRAKIDGTDNVDDFDYDDFKLVGYDPWPAIKGEPSF